MRSPYALGVPPEPGVHTLQALTLQVRVELIEALRPRDRHQEVPPAVSHHALDTALVVALTNSAEPVAEQVVLKLRERTRALATSSAQYLRTAIFELSYRMLCGTPPRKANADT